MTFPLLARIHVDRLGELAAVDALLHEPGERRRLAVVLADDGWGKTALLDEVVERYGGQTAIGFADLAESYEPLPLLDYLAEQFGTQGVDLTAYHRARDRLVQPDRVQVQLKNVTAIGSPIDIEVAAADWQGVLSSLLGHFLDGVEARRGQPRRLIVLDGYGDAAVPLRQWLDASFLTRLMLRDRIACVLAGARRPDIGAGRRGAAVWWLPLGPLAVGDVADWLAAAGLPATDRDAEFLWRGTAGIPGRIDRFIRTYMGDGDV